jgi:hypothetical protein
VVVRTNCHVHEHAVHRIQRPRDECVPVRHTDLDESHAGRSCAQLRAQMLYAHAYTLCRACLRHPQRDLCRSTAQLQSQWCFLDVQWSRNHCVDVAHSWYEEEEGTPAALSNCCLHPSSLLLPAGAHTRCVTWTSPAGGCSAPLPTATAA